MSQSVSTQQPDAAPEAIHAVAALMSAYPAGWALCGGWAVDAWLGRVTREHGDVDVSVFVQDQRALYEHLRGWQLLAHDPEWTPGPDDHWWQGRRRLSAGTHIHARPPERSGPMPRDGIATHEDGFDLEFYLDVRRGDEWVLSGEPRISIPLADAVYPSRWGVPAVAPEVFLFFKARDLRPADRADFSQVLPGLTQDQRDWLRGAITLLGHPWLRELASAREANTAAPPDAG